jgi:hypothetical protein
MASKRRKCKHFVKEVLRLYVNFLPVVLEVEIKDASWRRCNLMCQVPEILST